MSSYKRFPLLLMQKTFVCPSSCFLHASKANLVFPIPDGPVNTVTLLLSILVHISVISGFLWRKSQLIGAFIPFASYALTKSSTSKN